MPDPLPYLANGATQDARGLLSQAAHVGRTERVALLRADLFRRWRRGDRARVESYLEQFPALRDDPEAAVDLIYTEMLLRDELGEPPGVEEFGRRFPGLEASIRRQWELHELLRADEPGRATPRPSSAPLTQTGSGPEPGATLAHPSAGEAAGEASDLPFLPGYEMLGRVGRGGMGVVYKARQLGLNRLVAVKMIRDDAYAATDRARLRGEALAVARLQHPHIVQIYDFGEFRGRPYFSMELVEGGSLDERLKATPLPPAEAAALVEALAYAMAYAHRQGIIHRDLKPANVLLRAKSEIRSAKSETNSNTQEESPKPQTGRAGGSDLGHSDLGIVSDFGFRISDLEPKVTDFGLAKSLDPGASGASAAVVGTPSYMAPEQAAGRSGAVGPAADVYALGAILYETLTGRPPFKAATPLDTLTLVLDTEPVPPRRLQPKTPRDLETVCLKCLQKDPHRRYAGALDLAEDLRRFRARESILARPVGLHERGWRWCRRNPAVATLAGVLVAVVVGSLCGLTALYLQAEKEKGHALGEQLRAVTSEREAKANAEAAAEQKRRAEEVANFLLGMFEAADPLGIQGFTFVTPQGTGNHLSARDILKRGAERVRDKLRDQPVTQAALMDHIGSVYRTLGLFKEAGPLLEEALQIRQKELPPDDPDLAATLFNLAWLKQDLGRTEEAEPLYQKALAIRLRHFPEDHPHVTVIKFNLAWLYALTGEWGRSEPLFQEVLDTRLRQLSEGHREVAITRAGLAALYLERRDTMKALTLIAQAQKVFLKGNERLLQAASLFQEAVTLNQSGLPFSRAAAIGYLRQVRDIAASVLGEKHPYMGLILFELAHALEQQGEYAEAQDTYEKTLDIARQTVGLSHPKVVFLVQAYAQFLKDRGKASEGERLFEELLQRQTDRLGPNSRTLAASIMFHGLYRWECGDSAGELAELRRALAIFQKHSAEGNIYHCLCLGHLGKALLRKQAYAEAEDLFRQAVPMARRHFGEQDSAVGFLLGGQAAARLRQGHWSDVEDPLRQAVDLLRPHAGKYAADLSDAFANLNLYYRKVGNAAAAAGVARERQALWPKDPNQLYRAACEIATAATVGDGRDREEYLADGLNALREAAANGFDDLKTLQAARDLDPLRDREEFRQIVKRVESNAKAKRPKKTAGAARTGASTSAEPR